LARNKKILPHLEAVEVTGVAAEGMAIAKVDGLVVFIPFAAPGDIADIQLIKKKSAYAEGRITRLLTPSPLRTQPSCKHFGICGGCKWQHLIYEEQLACKSRQVTDSIERIGGLKATETFPIIASAQTEYYRNKLEFTFSDRRWLTEDEIRQSDVPLNMNGLGFHIPGMFDKVLDIGSCYLMDDISNQLRLAVREYCIGKGYDFFDLRGQAGFMRNLIVRVSATTGEVMLIVVFFYMERERIDALLSRLASSFPQITSLLYIINGKCNDTITDLDVITFSGKDHITEIMEGLTFRIGPKSFFQTNSLQAYELYKAVRRFAALSGEETVYDLYTGTGTIANFISKDAAKVIGIEYVAEAVEDARLNARLNGIDNATFFAGDMKDILCPEFMDANGRPDVIITDPPRAGMHDNVIKAILAASPQRIVYVSCNPATQARDLGLICAHYTLKAIQPVDMFPHTQHVENVALLIRNEE
jgi:23S rRNA (uracil1939-C5)-methyltransferase